MEADGKRSSVLHALVFLAVFLSCAAGLTPLTWPWYLALPLFAYAGITLALPILRRTAPRLPMGRLSGAPLASAAGLSLATASVLVGFHAVFRPDVTELAAGLPVAAFGNLLLAGICFSVINAALEELVFRGVLWHVIAEEWNGGVALAVTSLLFGWGHLHGYPPGPIGAVLAGLYGLTLGILRWWAGGLGLAVACHFCADATIFGIMLRSGAFGQPAE